MLVFFKEGVIWVRLVFFQDLYILFCIVKNNGEKVWIVRGNILIGVYELFFVNFFVDIFQIFELIKVFVGDNGIVIGGVVIIMEFMNFLDVYKDFFLSYEFFFKYLK